MCKKEDAEKEEEEEGEIDYPTCNVCTHVLHVYSSSMKKISILVIYLILANLKISIAHFKKFKKTTDI